MSMTASTREYRPKKPRGGYWQKIGVPSRGLHLFMQVKAGFPYQVYDSILEQTGIERQQLAKSLCIPPATLARRQQVGQFSPAESDRLYRFAEIFKLAIDLFEGNQKQTQAWLVRESKGLGGKTPLEMMHSATEAEAVVDLIGRLEHGIIA